MFRFFGLVLALAVGLLVSGRAWAAVEYTVTDLGKLPGGGNSFAYGGINASGQVAGLAYTAADLESAFLYSNGKMTDLGTLGGTQSWAYGINASGQVVGWSDTASAGDAFVYSNGTMTDLGTLPGGWGSAAYGINAGGQVVGESGTSSGYEHAFLYSNGSMTDLGTLPGDVESFAHSINGSGQVVGESEPSTGYSRAFLFSNGTMTDLGTLGTPFNYGSDATSINASGQVVGESGTSSGGSDAFLYSNGTMTDLNSLISPTSGWDLLWASGINDSGQICGYGSNPAGLTDAFLLTPVPEPSTITLLLASAACLLGYAWRRRRRVRHLASAAAMLLVLTAGNVQAQGVFNMGNGEASLSFVPVGNPGNAADPATGSLYGSVGYTYDMGKYDVTVGQYCQFLNAVAATDTYGLYNSYMAVDGLDGEYYPTVGITQSGSPGSYTYSVSYTASAWNSYVAYDRSLYPSALAAANDAPAFDVTWGDAARFANWLQNGQPTNLGEVAGSTETGAYTLNGATSESALTAISRNTGATYFIPSENEWYKAAYFDPSNSTYWTYPTQSNSTPMAWLSATGTNNANYGECELTNYLTPVGAFAGSPGPFGTYDMGGDVFQWNEANCLDESRGSRGGSWADDSVYLKSSSRSPDGPLAEFGNLGFRVASDPTGWVPEPSTITLLLASAAFLLGFGWRRRTMIKRTLMVGALAGVLTMTASASQAQGVFNMPNGEASLQFVPVGNPGNAADSTGYGSVGYAYQMGEYDVTVGQYAQFLNAVAATDTYGLYNSLYMSKGGLFGFGTVGITQSGSPGSYTYSVSYNASAWNSYVAYNSSLYPSALAAANDAPVFDASWGDAARFANWLQNGQPTNLGEVAGSTETGAYTLNGATSESALMAISRNAGATYFIPSENEWYKAAYFDRSNSTYWTYPTQSNSTPSNVLSATGTNNANFYNDGDSDPTNLLTPVGAFSASPGPYGTFDMGGDLFQWNEANYDNENLARGFRGGDWDDYSSDLESSSRYGGDPTGEYDAVGFRVASVPEPSTITLLLASAACLLGYGWRRRKTSRRVVPYLAVVIVASFASVTQAQGVFSMPSGETSLSFVPVGNPGNAADPSTGYGSVGYVYRMGEYDVTVGQYCQFLNAVAKTDTYGLYNSYMALDSNSTIVGSLYPTVGITQNGGSGNYTYSVTGGDSQGVNCPIFDVTWGDAARFSNWLQNGQPTGAEGPGTTETGAYTLNGDTTNLLGESRNTGATYFIPTENEWYKAAYYKPSNGTYWGYPTQSNSYPSNILSTTGTNNANFAGNPGYTDPTNYLTPVGAFASSPGPYGTYDMGGDVWQWNEAVIGSSRGLRGGSWYSDSDFLLSYYYRNSYAPTGELLFFGFRVAASVPEPSAITLLLASAACLLGFAWRWRKCDS